MHRLFSRLDMEPCRSKVDRTRRMFGTLSRPKSGTEVVIRRRRDAGSVPWYSPGQDEPLTPQEEALLPPRSQGAEAGECPVR